MDERGSEGKVEKGPSPTGIRRVGEVVRGASTDPEAVSKAVDPKSQKPVKQKKGKDQ